MPFCTFQYFFLFLVFLFGFQVGPNWLSQHFSGSRSRERGVIYGAAFWTNSTQEISFRKYEVITFGISPTTFGMFKYFKVASSTSTRYHLELDVSSCALLVGICSPRPSRFSYWLHLLQFGLSFLVSFDYSRLALSRELIHPRWYWTAFASYIRFYMLLLWK